MKNKYLAIALTISLALNLGFIAATIYQRLRPQKTLPGTSNLMQFHLPFEIAAEQKGKIAPIAREFKIKSLMYQDDILSKRVEILESLGETDNFNAEIIQSKTTELNSLENKLNQEFVATLLKINAILDSKQRLQLLYQLGKEWYSFNIQSHTLGDAHD